MIRPVFFRIMFFLLLLSLSAGLFGGCAKQSFREPLGPNESWQKALNLFHQERYYRSQQVLRDIVLNYSGSAIIDSAQFYLALCSFHLADYLTAADEFHRLVERYPYSKLTGDAVFFEARCYYEESPVYQLDQEFTGKALQGFQRFLEEYAGHSLLDSGYRYLSLCREKLARKEYAAASLYFDLAEYASAILYSDVVLDNYYDTPLAESALFLKGRSYHALKEWARARKELQLYLEKYPQGKHTVRVKQMLASAERSKDSSATSTP
ncbi:outer membrane protein assembly factor BamD [candidate division KSB1 bacterium]|nr:MAG: outer membrane protein assembly factor BamD [candidate division KSB1 bacterium]